MQRLMQRPAFLLAPRWSVKQPEGEAIYDEFAIGWNEIFDKTPPKPVEEPDEGSKCSSRRGSPGPEKGAPAPPPPPAPAVPEPGDGGWSSKALFSSKRPPPYLRIAKGKQSAIDRRMRERNLNVPNNQLRRPAAVIDPVLDQMRAELLEEQRHKRFERRQDRRLARRCRVKGHEDLEELEASYLDSELLQPLTHLAEEMHETRKPDVKRLSKEYFAAVNHRWGSPRSTHELLPPPPFSYR
jgi:hypothetical protein